MYRPSLIDLVAGSPALRRRQALARLLAHGLARMTVDGLENVPAEGPVVLAVNHRDFLDGPLLFAFVPRPVAFLTKSEAYTPRATPLLETTGQIKLVRSRPDVAAVRSALRILRAGGVVGVFPEGARGDGLVRTAKPGVGYFALRSGARVVPVACHGTHLMKQRRVPRPEVAISIGRPLTFDRVPDGRRVRRAEVLEATERVRVELAALVAATVPGEPQRVAA
jgi:1-acyl-sn-glycerol-3-phosphate acyltransferase